MVLYLGLESSKGTAERTLVTGERSRRGIAASYPGNLQSASSNFSSGASRSLRSRNRSSIFSSSRMAPR